MFQLTIANVTVIFSKFFGATDREATLEALGAASAKSVLFVDTGATPDLTATIRSLVDEGIEVVVRDHHKGEGRNPECADEIEHILGESARIVDRQSAPGCAQLIELGEFINVDAIVADPDYDGMLAAMKAVGISYEGMDSDAEVFDVRPKQSAETLTSLGWTAVRALSTLPPFNKERPEVSENAKKQLFERFVAAATGDTEARQSLESAVADYEAGVAEAQRLLAEKVSQPCGRVLLADTVGAKRSDLNTLSGGMEKRGAVVTVIRRSEGPIAKAHGIQISLAVAQAHQKELDLRTLVPQGMETGVPAGLLSNVPFLLHCSEGVWESTILPALSAKLGE